MHTQINECNKALKKKQTHFVYKVMHHQSPQAAVAWLLAEKFVSQGSVLSMTFFLPMVLGCKKIKRKYNKEGQGVGSMVM